MHSLQWSRIIAARPVQSTDRLGSGKARGVIWGSPGEKGLHRGVEHQREGLRGVGSLAGRPPPAPRFLLPAASACGPHRVPKPGSTFDLTVESRVQQRELQAQSSVEDVVTLPRGPWPLTAGLFSP